MDTLFAYRSFRMRWVRFSRTTRTEGATYRLNQQSYSDTCGFISDRTASTLRAWIEDYTKTVRRTKHRASASKRTGRLRYGLRRRPSVRARAICELHHRDRALQVDTTADGARARCSVRRKLFYYRPLCGRAARAQAGATAPLFNAWT